MFADEYDLIAIGSEMDRSHAATRKLLGRALRRFRLELERKGERVDG